MTTSSSTALMPLDPAVSPEQVTRILAIRANLLPQEITAGRNARRIRLFLAATLILVVAVSGGWYGYAIKDRNQAADASAEMDKKVGDLRRNTKDKKYADVTKSIDTAKTLKSDLKTLAATDLPWATLLNQLRSTATAKKVTITAVVASLAEQDSSGKSAAAAGTVGSLQISGTAADKKTIANFVEALPKISSKKVFPLTNAYLTTATQQDDNVWIFTMTADVTDDAECGRFTTACKSGGY